MFRSTFIALALVAAAPVQAATLANFDTAIGVYLEASPAEELYEEGGYAPAPSMIFEVGDTSLTTGDDNGTDACCTGGFVTTTNRTYMGEVALSAEGAVHSAGSVHASGQRLGLWRFGNFGSAVETITLGFDIDMAIAQIIDPLVGGTAESGTTVTIERDGAVIYSHSLHGIIDEFALGAAHAELFEYTFDLAPTDGIATQFDIRIGGLVNVGTDLAPVPLPAGAVLLLTGLGALGAGRLRRRRRS